MKKKLIAMLLVMTMAVAVTGCGDKKADTNAQSGAVSINGVDVPEVDPDDYVTLCDLSSIEVTAPVYTYSDENVKEDMQEQFEYFVQNKDAYKYTVVDHDEVQNGDVCDIDYEGVKDDVAFEGGTAQGYKLEIGSGSFIEGFEEGLIGHKTGEKVDLNLTFPEDYHSEDLAGADVVFHVTINGIYTREMPEMTDETLKSLDCGYDTVKAFEDSVKESLQSDCDEQAKTDKLDQMWEQIFEKSEVKEPGNEFIEYYKSEINRTMQNYADMYGMELEQFISQYMGGVTMEEYDKQLEEGAHESAKQDLVVQAIAKKADISVSNEDLKAFIESDYANYGYASAQDMINDIGEYSYKMYRLNALVEEYLLDGIVTFKDGEEMNIRDYYNGLMDDDEAEEDVEEIELDESDIELEGLEGEDIEIEDVEIVDDESEEDVEE